MATTRISDNQIATTTQAIIDTLSFLDGESVLRLPSGTVAQRPGTPAQKKDNIPLAEKKSRLSALQSLLKDQQKKFNKVNEIFAKPKSRITKFYLNGKFFN